MKKGITLTIALLCYSILFARTPQEAAQVASQFIGQSHAAPAQRMQRAVTATNIANPVELAYTQYQVDAQTPAVFVFNSVDTEGFVLVSAEDNARAVLGYSDHGSFDQENIPKNMQFWLQMYADELAHANTNTPPLKPGQVTVSGAKRAVATTYPTIAPILGNIEWGQDTPYNNLCPIVNGERCVTGCVATALSQIMYVHKHPTKGVGSKTYTSESNRLKLSANFGATAYDWDNLLPYYNNNYNSTQANAVATLMYHVGVASEMDYDPNGSGAASSQSIANLAKYFDYDAGVQTWLKDYMLEEDILAAIAADLEIGHPVYVSGATKNQEGHAFVCDGMQSNGYLHINWGWNGISNGYFALSALNPSQQGTGGSASDMAFTEGVDVYTGIQPDQGGIAQPLITVKSITFPSGKVISRNANVGISLEDFTSKGMATAKGTLSYYIYDTNDNLVKTVPIGTFDLPTGYGYTEPISVAAAIPNSIANGSYEMEIGYTDNTGTIHPILFKRKGVIRFPMTITSTTITIGEGNGNSNNGGENQAQPITGIDVSNIDQSNVWEIDLYSSYFWSDYESDDEVLIRFTIYSNSTTSVVGTYTLDATSSGKVGTIDADALHAVGYYQGCYQYTPKDLHLTITEGEDGALQVQYYLEVNDIVESKTLSIVEPSWYKYNTKQDQYEYYHKYITYELASTISASQALTMTKKLSHTNVTEMSYFVSGTISNIRNTPEEIVQHKTAQFDISDDGTATNPFYCFNTKWIDNTDFATGNEVTLGDEVIIYGQVQNYNGNTPRIKGYVFHHNRPTSFEITNLKIHTEGSTVHFSFESEAPNFHVKVIKADGDNVAEGIIDFKNVSVENLADGTYTLWIRPVDEAQEYYIGDAVEEQFTIDTSNAVDYAIYNLNVTTEGNVAHFSWESNAPYFHVKITNQEDLSIVNTIIDFKQAKLSDLADGTYTLWIRPVDEAQEYYVGDAVEEKFVIQTQTTSIEELNTQQPVILYDLMGRLVDNIPTGDNRSFNVPDDGIYIQCIGDKTTKIYINK